MLRTFTEHHVRPVQSLDGRWDFVIEPERKDRATLPKKYRRGIYVPSAWETIPGLENYRGRGWLRRTFHAPKAHALRLAFGGVSHTGIVYIDGKRIANHYDGYVPWDVVVTGLAEGEHELVVEVENTFGKHSALHTVADHWTSGGITRPVELQAVPAVFIDKIFATPVRTGKSWRLDVRVALRNVSGKSLKRRVVVSLGRARLDLGEVTVPGRAAKEAAGSFKRLAVKPWSAQRPQLYHLTAELLDGQNVVDDLVDRVGFRHIAIRGTKLLLNGKPLRLRGYNRHEYHGQFGAALPAEVLAGDVQLLKDLGCNFIRTSHYPNDIRFLDLCDSMGIYVWEETNSTSVSFKHPKYRRQITACAETMVGWHFNHPCIVIWATLNECDAKTPSGRREHGRMLNLLRKLDGSRPVTYASCAWKEDICLDLPDIISWNWYEGWYWGSIATIEESIERFLRWQDTRSKGRGKPVIISEFGAGGIAGIHRVAREKWSEEYQADMLDESLRVYLNHPRIAGAAIWQFCDVRISASGSGMARPGSRNNKGTVDEMRQPKLAYDVVKKRMHQAS